MADDSVVIGGVSFMSLYHHDGRFVRGGGLFAFSRRDPDGGRTIFCLDLAQDISRQAICSHSAWPHAVSNGMNELLVHLAGSQQTPGEVEPGATFPPIRYALFEEPGADVADADHDGEVGGDALDGDEMGGDAAVTRAAGQVA